MSTNDNDLVQELQEQNNILNEMIKQLTVEVREGKRAVDRDDIESKLEVLYDPFDVSNPLVIYGEIPPEPDKGFPQGQEIRWLYPRYRDVRGYRGWKLFKWGDEYTGKNGELLSSLIPDPPQRMEEQSNINSVVRRGDVVLARIDKRIAVSRRLKMQLESARRRGGLRDHEAKVVREGVTLVGKGMSTDESPKKFAKVPAHTGDYHTDFPIKSKE